MTLQDFKDQVAREHKRKFRSWRVVLKRYRMGQIHFMDVMDISDRAAELFAKEREKDASPKWIPVTESLPEVEEGYNSYSVLIYTEETYTWTGYYNHWKEQWFSGTEKVIVTHWMKIPERP